MDEEALIRALKEGRIAGAGVDVFEEEPVSVYHPLLHMENVIATPHSAWSVSYTHLTWDSAQSRPSTPRAGTKRSCL